MRLAFRLRLYLLGVHLAVGAALAAAYLSLPPPRPAGWLVLTVELAFAVSLVMGWRWISALSVPTRLVELGTDLIEERDFASSFRSVGQPEMDRLIEVYNRMIRELRHERLRVREQQAFLEQLVQASPTGILICDLDGNLVETNPSARRLLGSADGRGGDRERPDGSGVVGSGIVGPGGDGPGGDGPGGDSPGGGGRDSDPGGPISGLPEPWGEALPSLAPGRSARVALADGRQVRCQAAELLDRGFPRRFYLLDELTDELRRSERSAYEKLIRLVSHEVNNSVGAVTSLLDSLSHFARKVDAADRRTFERAVGVASDRLERLRAFVDGFAQVVRLPEPLLRPLDLEELVRDLVTLLRPSFDARSLRLELPESDAAGRLIVEADRAQLEQVLVNVLENAADATAGRPGEAADGQKTPGPITVRLGRDTDGWPILTLDDHGPGIDPESAPELFTPFFTTKPQGSGLGLAMVKEILRRHGFDFALESRPGPKAEPEGARFTLRFRPRAPNAGSGPAGGGPGNR